MAKKKRQRSREVEEGGYIYRQYSDGSVTVVATKDPAGQKLVGVRITQESDPKRWNAITASIGTWKQFRHDRAAQLTATGLKSIAIIGGAVAATRKPKKGKKRGHKVTASLPMPELPEEEEEASGTILGLPTPIVVVGGLATVGLIAYLMFSGGSKDSEKGRRSREAA